MSQEIDTGLLDHIAAHTPLQLTTFVQALHEQDKRPDGAVSHTIEHEPGQPPRHVVTLSGARGTGATFWEAVTTARRLLALAAAEHTNPLIKALRDATPDQVRELLQLLNPESPRDASITIAWHPMVEKPQLEAKRERGVEAYGPTFDRAVEALDTEGYL